MRKFFLTKDDKILVFWTIIIVPIIFLIFLFFFASKGFLGPMPSIESLENPKINLASQVISEDGQLLGNIWIKNQNRVYLEYDQLPEYLVKALLAAEDIRFYKHSGIDFKGTIRAIIFLGKKGGGSTITQQLAKLLFHDQPSSIFERMKQKIKEYIIAAKLERSYSKNEIITMYLNQIDFLYNAVGINSAARVYFNTVPDSLKIEECALLVGMIKNPYYYNPVNENSRERSLNRRNVVLSQMYKYGFITKKQRDSLQNIPIIIKFNPISTNLGIATYFREYLRLTLSATKPNKKRYYDYELYKIDSMKWENNPLYGWCNKNKKPDGTYYDLYTDGLKIYTTINYKMQKYAEEAVKEHLKELQKVFWKEIKNYPNYPFAHEVTKEERDRIIRNAILTSDRGRSLRQQGYSEEEIMKAFKTPVKMNIFTWDGPKDTIMTPYDSIIYHKTFLQTGFMAIEPLTGHVKAYVGGIDFRFFKYDHVTQARRQAGSTFKPFLYVLAMQEGYSPCDKVPNVPQVFEINGKIWEPRSLSKPQDLNQERTLLWGLARSENNISAWLVKQFKPQPIVDIAHAIGIKSYIDPVPSMIFGTSDMTVEEMVAAYNTFASKGVYIEPVYITKIEDKYGNVLIQYYPEKREAISYQTAYLMLKLMEGVTSANLNEGYMRTGTAAALRFRDFGFTAQIAGKTGTTQRNSDAWFIGIVPKLTAGVWVGCDDRGIHFWSTMGTGAKSALPIWGRFMKKVFNDQSLGISQLDFFEPPENFNFNVDLNCSKTKTTETIIPINEDYINE